TSQVDYGTTTSYGSRLVDATSATIHSVTLTGLANNTIYHFKATSTDTYGNTGAGSDGIFVTSTNLLANGGFEVGAGWKPVNQAAIDSNPADAHAGNKSLQLVATGPFQATGQTVSVTPGQTYSFSAFGRSSNGGGVFALVASDTNGSFVSETDLPFAGTTSWIGVTTTFKAAANVVLLTVYADNTATGTFWFDDISLTTTAN